MTFHGKTFLTKILVIFIIYFVYGCANTNLVNLRDAKNAVIEYHNSGNYDKDASKAIAEAEDEFNKIVIKKNDAVVFDVDETALSNYNFNKDLDFGYVSNLWDKWIDAEKAPAIDQVKELYDYLLKKNVKILFITGRKSYQYEATVKNLELVGYKSFDTLITRAKDELKETAKEYKTRKRVELTQKGYHIIGTVGDQWSDLEGADHGIQVKIPNYQYLIK